MYYKERESDPAAAYAYNEMQKKLASERMAQVAAKKKAKKNKQ